jgi:hypothetical protein
LSLRLLRLEGEVIEIIAEIVGCLNVSSADCDRAVELLERLESHQLNPLMLKKHPEVVRTVLKVMPVLKVFNQCINGLKISLYNYIFSCEATWGM